MQCRGGQLGGTPVLEALEGQQMAVTIQPTMQVGCIRDAHQHFYDAKPLCCNVDMQVSKVCGALQLLFTKQCHYSVSADSAQASCGKKSCPSFFAM